MNNTPTPETEAQYKEYARRDNNVKCVDIDFARKLERERDEARHKLEIETIREQCSQCKVSWSPSLVESGWCIFCILKEAKEERDQLRKVCDELAFQLACTHKETGCQSQCPVTATLSNYNQLPHVIERNKGK